MRALISSEHEEQCALVEWMTLKGIKYFSIPNGFFANAKEGSKLKRSGLQPGVPDLCIPIMRSGHGALFLEVKRKSGSYVSKIQQEWIDYLRSAGYKCEICFGFDHCVRVIEDYLG